jgi:hypothetical protein
VPEENVALSRPAALRARLPDTKGGASDLGRCPGTTKTGGLRCQRWRGAGQLSRRTAAVRRRLMQLREDGSFDVEGFEHTVEIVPRQELIVGFSSHPTQGITWNACANLQLGRGYANLGGHCSWLAACPTTRVRGARWRRRCPRPGHVFDAWRSLVMKGSPVRIRASASVAEPDSGGRAQLVPAIARRSVFRF